MFADFPNGRVVAEEETRQRDAWFADVQAKGLVADIGLVDADQAGDAQLGLRVGVDVEEDASSFGDAVDGDALEGVLAFGPHVQLELQEGPAENRAASVLRVDARLGREPHAVLGFVVGFCCTWQTTR